MTSTSPAERPVSAGRALPFATLSRTRQLAALMAISVVTTAVLVGTATGRTSARTDGGGHLAGRGELLLRHELRSSDTALPQRRRVPREGLSAEAPEQGRRRGRIAHLVAADYVDVDVAGLAVRASRFDAVKVIHRGARGPGLRSRGPEIERSIGIAQFRRALRSHDAGVDERRGGIRDLRVLGFGGDRDGDAMLPYQCDEIGTAKAIVPNFDDVA